ncbi:hypothetical protein JX266_000398 [Neoarthrinium moseri]|uniref:uncharacterized protein n=1 Tax=Neoarthrinium moseri TaxID=1658444 RepID=UPI001FDDA318|nr:uncharacterized protein JN550_012271 [Neoarthrinium moseri]KAI1855533.1 hypothetical protein JX266_000398 [Neoarthrinium moseri]KAI1859009.1 hypothetical protein JN550_012271 [Neoarthrinium moseri]
MEAKRHSKKTTGHRRQGQTLASIIEYPVACCGLWDADEYTCILHPRDPPLEWHVDQFVKAREGFKRAYRVSLFVTRKRHDLEIKNLHESRRHKLRLRDLPQSKDYPHCEIRSREQQKRLLGKTCAVHKLNYKCKIPWQVRKACFVCQLHRMERQHAKENQRLYTEYHDNVLEACMKCNYNVGGWECIEWQPPAREPAEYWAENTTRAHRVLHVTSWSENLQGRLRNESRTCRKKALLAEERKIEVWKRLGWSENSLNGRWGQYSISESH